MIIVRMMGDTSLATVNRHYINIDDEMLEEIVDGWCVSELPAFTPNHLRGPAEFAPLRALLPPLACAPCVASRRRHSSVALRSL
jgi:hypothetical protein